MRSTSGDYTRRVLSLTLLKSRIRDGEGNAYPIFTGFLSARLLDTVTQVPAFSDATTHAEIGANVNSNPVEGWQRPKNGTKVQEIAERFSKPGEIMPNPVLLAALEPLDPEVVYTSDDGTQTCIVELDEVQSPLIVLDGQHRIKGIAASSQPDNPIPFVLLADVGAAVYNRSMFARIFAEVTTQSSKLDALHDAWLKYAFELDHFEPVGVPPVATDDKKAMEVATQLVRWNPAPPQTNPFHDRVKLNPVRSMQPPIGKGFHYDAMALSSLIRTHYFSLTARQTNLGASVIAAGLADALVALKDVCTTPLDRSVFFGEPEFRQQPMQDAFIAACLARMASSGVPGDWRDLFRSLNFVNSNWNFRPWVVRLDGVSGGLSKKLASAIMSEAFTTGALPPGAVDIPSHLKGDGAELELEVRRMSSVRASRAPGIRLTFPTLRHGVFPLPAHSDYRIYLVGCSSSIGKITAWDMDSQRTEFSKSVLETQGILLSKPSGDSRELRFKVEFYGGVEETLKLTVNW